MNYSYMGIFDLEACNSFEDSICNLISASAKDGFSYAEIFTALHKKVDIALYDYEIDTILGDYRIT